MNRIAKAVQPLVLVAIVSIMSAYLGARAVTPGVAAVKHTQPLMIVPVDGPGKPTSCC